jgi:hypothetical protein
MMAKSTPRGRDAIPPFQEIARQPFGCKVCGGDLVYRKTCPKCPPVFQCLDCFRRHPPKPKPQVR